jgi:phosphoglycolate phosphatase
MRFKCVIFDLDGTLADTLGDIADSMNRALESRGFPPVETARYTDLVGGGIRRLTFLTLPPAARDQGTVEAVAVQAAAFYAEKPLVYTQAYPGIPEMAAELKRLKVRTAVLTNKPDPVARQVADGLFPPLTFDIVQGDAPGIQRKPDPAAAWDIILALGATPRETIFAGDSEVDMQTALAADCHALGVSWGYRSRRVLEEAGAERIIDRPEELLRLIRETRM